MEKKEFNIAPERDSLSPCLIYIDKEGHWYHKGVEMIRKDFIQLFYQNMSLDSEGRYVINWNDESCYVEVEDTAFMVCSVAYQEATGAQNDRYILLLSDGGKEDLKPDTLFIGQADVLYCRVKENIFPARFKRAAYYQLAQYIEEEDEYYFLPLNENRYGIPLLGSEGLAISNLLAQQP